MPLVWGTARIAGNLIWYGNFYSVAIQQSGGGGKGGATGGGKGQQGGVTYNYFVSVEIALCEGPVTDIPNCWNSKALGTTSSFGFSKFLGDYAQAAWSYLVPPSPYSAAALNYHGLAYVAEANLALGSSTELPNFNFEVQRYLPTEDTTAPHPDVLPNDVLLDFLTNTFYGVGFPVPRLDVAMRAYHDYCLASGFFVSPALTEQKSASSFIQELLDATNCSARWSDGFLTIVPWGDAVMTGNGVTFTPDVAPKYDIGEDDLLPNQGSAGSGSTNSKAPIICVRKRKSDMLNALKNEYLDRSNNYDPAVVEWKDQASIDDFGLRAGSLKQMHFFCKPGPATLSVQLQLVREQIPAEYTFTIDRRFILLDVEDLVTLTRPVMGLDHLPVRIKEIQENEDKSLTMTAEEFMGTASGTSSQPVMSITAANYNVNPGVIADVIAFIPSAALAATNGGGLQVWAAVCGANHALYGGCNIYGSSDGITYTYIGKLLGSSRMGKLTAPLPTYPVNPSGATIDSIDTLSVDLSESGSTLLSGTTQDAQAFNTACYVDGEIIGYQTATLTGTNQYDLTYLVRAGYGGTTAAHPTGSSFARLDQSGIFKETINAALFGSVLHFKFQPFNIWGGGMPDLASLPDHTLFLGQDADPSCIGLALDSYEEDPVFDEGLLHPVGHTVIQDLIIALDAAIDDDALIEEAGLFEADPINNI